MKRALTLGFSILLVSCQTQSFRPSSNIPVQQQVNQQSQQNFEQNIRSSSPLNLALNPALRSQLKPTTTEPTPLTDRPEQVNTQQLTHIFGTENDLTPSYVDAHSMYFDYLHNGKSTIEMILAHDGHSQAAQWVTHWRDTLSKGAIWPDHNSTTYNGPFKALEHGLPSVDSGWFGLRNAREKSQEYYEMALKSWKPELAPDHPDQAEAWAWLGRTSHFIQDMSVPFHTRSLVRPAQAFFHNAYEVSSEKLFDNYLPVRNHNPFGVWANGPYPENEVWGIYFPAGIQAGELIVKTAEQSQPFYDLVAQRSNDENGNWEKTRAVMIPLGAKSTAGLVISFLTEVGALKP